MHDAAAFEVQYFVPMMTQEERKSTDILHNLKKRATVSANSGVAGRGNRLVGVQPLYR